MNNFIAVGNDELQHTRVKEGDLVRCSAGYAGRVQYGTDGNNNKSGLLGFISVGDDAYLVAINGQLLSGCELV